MENIKKKKTDYESTKIYTKKYNQSNINIQLDRELVSKLRDKIGNQSVKSFLEGYLSEYLKD
jgi:hypothetical protein